MFVFVQTVLCQEPHPYSFSVALWLYDITRSVTEGMGLGQRHPFPNFGYKLTISHKGFKKGSASVIRGHGEFEEHVDLPSHSFIFRNTLDQMTTDVAL